jgi:hypothetical protein
MDRRFTLIAIGTAAGLPDMRFDLYRMGLTWSRAFSERYEVQNVPVLLLGSEGFARASQPCCWGRRGRRTLFSVLPTSVVVTSRLTSRLGVLLGRRLHSNGLVTVAIGLLDDAYPAACLHGWRDVYRSVLIVQVERFGRDDFTGDGDLNGLAGVVALDLAVNRIGRCLRRFVGGCGLRFLLNLFALLGSRTLVLGEGRAGKNERNNTDTHRLHTYLS